MHRIFLGCWCRPASWEFPKAKVSKDARAAFTHLQNSCQMAFSKLLQDMHAPRDQKLRKGHDPLLNAGVFPLCLLLCPLGAGEGNQPIGALAAVGSFPRRSIWVAPLGVRHSAGHPFFYWWYLDFYEIDQKDSSIICGFRRGGIQFFLEFFLNVWWGSFEKLFVARGCEFPRPEVVSLSTSIFFLPKKNRPSKEEE